MAKSTKSSVPAPVSSKKLSKSEIDNLFAKITAAEAKVTKAQDAVMAAINERSEAVLAVKTALGTGPFNVKGRGLVTIRSRAQKEEVENEDGTVEKQETGKFTHFLVGQGDSAGVIDVG